MATTLRDTHPEMAARYEQLVRLVAAEGGKVWIVSSTRSRAVQEDLRRRWENGTYKVPSVADPNADGGVSPWGWRWVGSKHMPQADGFSHALDLGWSGIANARFVELAKSCGLRQTVVRDGRVLEAWHYQWASGRVIFPAPAMTAAPEAPAATPVPIPTNRRHRMFGWTCDQNDGTQAGYLWTGRHVISLHALDAVAWGLFVTHGVPNIGHLNEQGHNVLLSRLTGAVDPQGSIGTWGHQ